MNLHSIASSWVGIVNPNKRGTIQISTGYVTEPGGHRRPTYRTIHNVPMQVQALTERDIAHAEALNVGGSSHVVYLHGRLDGLVRPENKGGDLITFDHRVWLVTGVLEDWPKWCKVAVTLQADKPS